MWSWALGVQNPNADKIFMKTPLQCILALTFLIGGCGKVSLSLIGSAKTESPSLGTPGFTPEIKGFPLSGDTYIQERNAVAFAPDGSHYVLMSGILAQKFSPSGMMVQEFRRAAMDLKAIATDSSGNFYLMGATVIDKYSSTGTLLASITLSGSPAYTYIHRLKIGSGGEFYVMTYVTGISSNAVLKFDSSGAFLNQVGGNGATDITFDSSGNIFLPFGNFVQKLDASGGFISQIGSAGNPPFNTGLASTVAIGSADTLYVGENGANLHVLQFDNTGTQQGNFDLGGDDGRVYSSDTLTFNAGNLYIAANYNPADPKWATGQGKIYEFTAAGVPVKTLTENYPHNYTMPGPSSMTISGLGLYYLVSSKGILRFDKNGSYLGTITEAGATNFGTLGGVSTDAAGNLYATDLANNEIYKFTANGTFVMKFGSGAGSGDGQFNQPKQARVNSQGFIFVLDVGNNRIQKFDSQGNYAGQFGRSGSAPGQFSVPIDLFVDFNDQIYVADALNARVQKFTSDGVYLSSLGTGPLIMPYMIFVNSEDHIFVIDAANISVQEFDKNGAFIRKFADSGQIVNPGGMTGDSLGNLYISEGSSSVVQKFNSAGHLVND